MATTAREGTIYPISLRELDVLEVYDVTPGMRRVVLGGPNLHAHRRDGVTVPPLRTLGFDDDVKILPPDPATGTLGIDLPTNNDRGTVDWPPGSFEYTRTYTVRRFDADRNELTIDFALHRTGLASTWARRVSPGETLLVAGPRHSAGLPVGADWMLIGGDETALPAIGHCLEKLPASMAATVVIEVAEPGHHQDLTSAASVDITWLYRSENDGRSRLVEAVQGAPWRPGQPYLWVAGETLTIKPLRRWAKVEKEIPKQFVEIVGYWRHREVATVADDPEVVDLSAEEDATSALHEMSELLPPLALRTAVTLGIFEAIDGGAATSDDIAERCGADPVALRKLLRHLTLMNLLRSTGTGHELTEAGSLLADPDHFVTGALHFDSIHTRLDLTFLGLLEAIRTGRAVGWEGVTVAERMQDPVFAADFHDERARDAQYRAPALPDAVDFSGVTTIGVVGEGGGVYADTLLRMLPQIRVRLVGLPSVTERAFADVSADRRDRVLRIDASEFTPLTEPVDLVVAGGVLETLPDGDAAMLLRSLGASSGRVVLVTDLLDPDTTDDHDTEDDLRLLCLHGAGRRTEDEARALVASIGGSSVRVAPLGWGSNVVEFELDRRG
ncbi:SIP domain-containing protein [Rhodococcus triatomae]|uniref:NADPH-dependent ferric siderophore reductase, contains FAD-binding and SIP domains n=1 Tax=Rhodococcus triatomae TaxID=300028 RepID=A0A1G8P3I0_9NOCA|nr:siderophore-interacting protein [Rhodococcus triatomae]QNG18773.1 SIP domain-containing protein [Rhodococcus triatomae]QNG25315.1 SIP domain-containing protein [Rhodococcus triatomae]SDI86390.1 NADPH-dependent ferric siderophore reductase, contains FAD-binding and SIP domains [Rhodococcus triatomae]